MERCKEIALELNHFLSSKLFYFLDEYNDDNKPTIIQIILASSIGLIIAAAMHFRFRKVRHHRIIPYIRVSSTGQPLKLERFPHYVARQMGFVDKRECPYLCKLASAYIRKEEGCEEDMYSFFGDDPGADSLFIKLVEEFERCILSYFAFHWSNASFMISQRVTKNLKVARIFTTLVEEMKAIGLVSADDSQCTHVMVPMAHKDRSPLLLFMGGGMGAGKSTADAFKESDVIYRALSSRGRDVIMDGTLSWVPFVVQTITMARNVHRKHYRMGPGYKVHSDGSVTENYWEQLDEESELVDGNKKRKPYRIELEKTLLVDPDEIKILKTLERLNEAADSIYELYQQPNPAYERGAVWKDIVMSPSRLSIQKELMHSIQKAEASK
ncbi:hypothetical protein Ccrd_009186 [Cynara cardunculus var. scolymus]|uniref:Zeta toxin domain-containing protein n=1 Tax=Cynara cardunculus var. scolymus TaxID=59895 RepID=A0A103YNQ7_CYNCS|nr:hypothetical protein Ccrd_009186 [Cynara cardunculus var. scolymus]